MSVISPIDQPNRRRRSTPVSSHVAPSRAAQSSTALRRNAPEGDRLPRSVRPLARTTTAAERASESKKQQAVPRLEVVPRRRRAVGIVVVACVVLFSLLLGAVAFQTKLAQNQLALDETERAVRDAGERYDILRRQRAQLRSPNRLAIEAQRLGMVPAETGELLTIDPAVVAAVAVAASGLPNNVFDKRGTSLEQFGQVKAVTGDAP